MPLPALATTPNGSVVALSIPNMALCCVTVCCDWGDFWHQHAFAQLENKIPSAGWEAPRQEKEARHLPPPCPLAPKCVFPNSLPPAHTHTHRHHRQQPRGNWRHSWDSSFSPPPPEGRREGGSNGGGWFALTGLEWAFHFRSSHFFFLHKSWRGKASPSEEAMLYSMLQRPLAQTSATFQLRLSPYLQHFLEANNQHLQCPAAL